MTQNERAIVTGFVVFAVFALVAALASCGPAVIDRVR